MNIKRNNGKFTQCALWVELECLFCHKKISIKESQLKYGRGKYCSRKCCDEHKKVICVGKGNGSFGRKMGEEEKQRRSHITKQSWKNPIVKKKHNIGMKNFVKIHGYYPGSDPLSLLKRKQTLIAKYGVDHVWKLTESRKKCEETCLKLYGKNSWQIANEALKIFSSAIEKKTEDILKNNGIKFQAEYSIFTDEGEKIYDFYLPDSKTLIEVDGDFWHGNPEIYPKETLLEIQQINKKNDIFKNELALRLGFRLLRFWEHEVNHPEFEKTLLAMI